MSKTAAYIRVSSKDQKLDGQRAEVQRYLKANGLEDDVEWFSDKATGAHMDRPGFQSLQHAIAKGGVTEVVIYKLERVFRSTLDCLNTVNGWDRQDIALRIVDYGGQPIDTKSATGMCMLTMMAAFAQMERANSRERQAAGIQAVRDANGGKCTWGGSAQGRRLALSEEKEGAITDLAGSGKGPTQIARIVGVSRQTVYRVLKE